MGHCGLLAADLYGKVFDTIYDGTLYGHWEAIVTMQQLIVLASPDGVVDMTPQAIAARTSIPREIIEKGLQVLSEPDPYTRTPGEEGRRIVLVDNHRPWGWRLVNHWKYMAMRDMEAKRRADRERLAEKRKEINDVATVSQSVANVAHTDTDIDTYKDKRIKTKPPVAALPLPLWINRETWESYVKTRPAKVRKPESLNAAIAKLEKFKAEGYDPNEIVATSLANGWQGLFRPKDTPAAKEPVVSRPVVLTCAYCDARATGTVSGIRHCSAHLFWAMDGRKIA